MKALMNSWWKEFSFYSFWDDSASEEFTRPLINFSLEMWTTHTTPSTYYDYNDKGRWRGQHIRIYISRYLIGLTIPYWKLPDYIPTRRDLERRYRHAQHVEKLARERNAATKV